MILTNALIKKLSAISVITLCLSACSNNAVDSESGSANNDNYPDTFEGFNRKVFAINDTLDGLLLKPVTKGYKAVIPDPIETNISNFFSNLDDVGNVVNNVLQFKFVDALSDTQRILINSTIGFAGLVDIATATGLEKHDEDFGQTLAKWGIGSGPYVMLPLLGPSSLRDGVAKLSVDRLTDVTNYSDASIELLVLETIKKRSQLLSQESVLKDLSSDKYSALRGIWVENRKFLVNDGKMDEASESDMIDELESLDSL